MAREGGKKPKTYACEGIKLSVDIVIPPAESSPGKLKLLIVTPGRPLKALKLSSFDKLTVSKIVPSAVTRSLLVDIVHWNEGLCSKNVAN